MTAIGFIQNQVNNDFQNPWGVRCTLTMIDVPEPFPAFNVIITDEPDLAGAGGYHGPDHVAKVFKNVSTNWVRTFSHEVLEMLVDPDITNRTPTLTVTTPPPTNITGKVLKEVCDPTALCYDGTYNGPANPLSPLSMCDFAYPSWYVYGTLCPWDFLQKCPAPYTYVGPTGFAQILVGANWFNINNAGITPALDPALPLFGTGPMVAPIGVGQHYKP